MQIVNITEAKANLSNLLKEIEDLGSEIIIGRAGKPIAKIIKYEPERSSKRIGILKNKIKINADFGKWPDDIAKSFGLKN